MAVAIGTLLALAVGVFASIVGLDRERSFYPTVTMVVGALYSLFAVMGGSTQALVLEAVVGLVFIVAAAIGFRWSLWVVVGALAAHGIFDFIHRALITNSGVPAYWPGFCGAYDVTAAAYLAGLLWTARVRATP